MLFLWIALFSVTNTDGLSYTHHANIVDHLNSINTTKLWYQLLQYTLHETLTAKVHYLGFYFRRLYGNISELKRWCIPRSPGSDPVIRYHMMSLTPCGFVQIELEINKYDTRWDVEVPKQLFIQVYFLVFEMDVSHMRCEHSAFIMAYHNFHKSNWALPDSWSFCGHRRPWYETAPSRQVGMLLRQLNVQQRCNITFIFTSLEREVANIYIMHRNIFTLPLLQPNERIAVAANSLLPLDVHNWRVMVDYGFRLYVSSLRGCCSSNRVAIYDGFQEDFSLRYKVDSNGERYERNLNLYSNYFQMEVHFHLYKLNYSLNEELLMKTRFERVLLPVKTVKMNSVTTVSSNGTLLYVAYSLGKPRRHGVYPNVSFVIRRFDGWNEGSCKFGGYLISEALHHSTDKVKYTLGPFCSKSIPTEPFVGTHGHKSLVFGKHEVYIIFYAFGPLYFIDIDLVLLPSVCEGIFELPIICLDDSQITQYVARKDAHNYRVTCLKKFRQNNQMYLKFTVISVINCIILQGMSYSRVEEERYEILYPVSVNIAVKRPPPFLQLGVRTGRSGTFLSYININAKFHAEHLNRTLQTIVNNSEIINLRVINVKVYQRIAYSMYIKATAEIDRTCTNASGCIERVGYSDGKLIQRITLVNLCGFAVLKAPGVIIMSLYIRRLHSGTSRQRKSAHIMHIVISKIQCNKLVKRRTHDKLTIQRDSGGVSHTIKMTSNSVRLELFQRFGLVIEKSPSCVSLELDYRIERLQTQSQIRYMQIGDTKKDVHVIEASINSYM